MTTCTVMGSVSVCFVHAILLYKGQSNSALVEVIIWLYFTSCCPKVLFAKSSRSGIMKKLAFYIFKKAKVQISCPSMQADKFQCRLISAYDIYCLDGVMSLVSMPDILS